MRRTLLAAMAALTLLLGPVAPAHAATTTVKGTNAFTKMWVSNGSKATVAKLYAPGGGACSVKYIRVELRGIDGKKYLAEAGCYPGAVWAASLVFNNKIVSCTGFRVVWKPVGKFWRVHVPRSCTPKLTNKIRLYAFVDDYSAAPGEAGPTKVIPRG